MRWSEELQTRPEEVLMQAQAWRLRLYTFVRSGLL